MTNSDKLAEVETLLAERDAVVGWLARLDDATGSVPAAVQDRVRLDYQLRLDGVTHRLKDHSEAVTSKLAEDRAELADLLARENTSREALAEAELRHLVGEYDAARFEKEEKQHLAAVTECESARSDAAERVASLEQLLAMIVAPPGDPAAPSSRESGPMETVAEATPAEGDLLVDLLEDEEEELLTVFDDRVESPELEIELVEADEAETSEESADLVAETGSDRSGPLSFRPGSGMPAERDREIPSFGMPAEMPTRFTPVPESVRTVPAVAQPAVASTSTPASPRRSPVLEDDIVASGPTPSPTNAPVGRTARCGECSAMNRASEWYCEKCGAELTMG